MATIVTKQTGFDYTNTIKKSLMQERKVNSIPYIQTKNFHDKQIDYNTDYFIPVYVANNFKKIKLDDECVLMSIVGASVGNIGYFDHREDSFLSGAICVIKSDDKRFLKRIYHYMHSEYGQKQIATTTKGAAQATITIEDIRNYVIKYPQSSIDEAKIYLLLDLIDSRIKTQNKIIEELTSLKKNISNKIFHNMHKKRLGEICNLYQPQTLSQQAIDQEGNYFVYGANGIIGRHTKFNHKEAEVCVTCRGSTSGTVFITKPMSWINGNAMVVHPKESTNIVFLKQSLQTIKWEKYITGSGQPQLIQSVMESIAIPYCAFDIQNKIGNGLELIDQKINKLIRERDLYIIQKKYLLANLFI